MCEAFVVLCINRSRGGGQITSMATMETLLSWLGIYRYGTEQRFQLIYVPNF